MITPEPVSKPDKRRKYDDAFKAKVLRLTQERRSTGAAARQLDSSEKLLYRWQRQQAAAELVSDELARDPEVRALLAELQRVPRERALLKTALASCLLSAQA